MKLGTRIASDLETLFHLREYTPVPETVKKSSMSVWDCVQPSLDDMYEFARI